MTVIGTRRVPLKGSIRVKSFRKLGVRYFGSLKYKDPILFGILYSGPLFSEAPI